MLIIINSPVETGPSIEGVVMLITIRFFGSSFSKSVFTNLSRSSTVSSFRYSSSNLLAVFPNFHEMTVSHGPYSSIPWARESLSFPFSVWIEKWIIQTQRWDRILRPKFFGIEKMPPQTFQMFPSNNIRHV